MTGPGQRLMPQQAPPTTNGYRPGGVQGSPLSTRTRPKGYAALAVALIVGLGALGYYFYTTAGSKVAVVVAVQDIPVGHTITRDELSTVEVSGGVTAVAGGNLSSLVGQQAAVEILPNTLVQRSMVTTGSTVKAGQSLVGVAADPGQIPSSGLIPGDKVEVLQLSQKGTSSAPSSSGSAAAAAVLVPSATVYDVRPNTSTSGGTLLTLIVPSADSYGVAQASNNSLIALVKIGG
jgi:SAF domain